MKKTLIGIVGGLLVWYLAASWVEFDIYWMSDASTWDEPVRLLVLLSAVGMGGAGAIFGSIS